MAVRKVAVMGHPVLREVAKKVPEKGIGTPQLQSLIKDMVDTMFEYGGRGLAAPQIHESLQIVVMIWDFEKGEKPSLLCLINPEIKSLTSDASSYWEGCLSVPGMRGYVERPNKIEVKAFDADGKRLAFTAEGFAATVIQHECDHLLGKLYLDRMTDLTKFVFNHEYQKFHAPQESESEQEE